jgi:eukaryotic-like serine/threonine-protein kinase
VQAMKERFFREAESAGRLVHPNIVTIYDAGDDGDISYIAMELLSGCDLKDYTPKDKLLPVSETLEAIAKVAEALDYAHQQGIVHRDIKPANIMRLKDGTIKVTDFGIARITSQSKTATGTVMGTPSYMSPEQLAGHKVDGRADLFSLGVTLYELLTGEKPFTGESVATLMFRIANAPHAIITQARVDLPPGTESIIDKALEKDPAKRYQRGSEMAKDLRGMVAKVQAAGAN